MIICFKDVIEELLEVVEVKQQSQQAAKMLWNQVYLGSRINGLPCGSPSPIVKRPVEEVEEETEAGEARRIQRHG